MFILKQQLNLGKKSEHYGIFTLHQSSLQNPQPAIMVKTDSHWREKDEIGALSKPH